MREIASHLATHPGRAQALVARSWILHWPHRSRALALAPDAADDLSRPHAGTAPYRIDLPPALAREVADFADARGMTAADVMTAALVAHVRGIP